MLLQGERKGNTVWSCALFEASAHQYLWRCWVRGFNPVARTMAGYTNTKSPVEEIMS